MTADRPRILLSGATGQLGGELRETLARVGTVIAPSRAELDLTDEATLRQVIRSVRPDVLVNAAAYTAVDRAETDRERCALINAVAPGVLAEETARLGALLVHYSTDYVFDGTLARPYTESDECAPLNFYGRTKLEGERAITAVGGRHLILRTSWIYGLRGANFLRTMWRLALERAEIRVVDDQTGSPTWSRSLAEATAILVPRAYAVQDDTASGVYHLSSAGSTTWCSFARAILSRHDVPDGTMQPRVTPIRTEDYPTAARRPANSVLDCGRIRARFDVTIPDWQSDLERVLDALANQ
jgi:dTDP-4-dehydrorhamnose reductase